MKLKQTQLRTTEEFEDKIFSNKENRYKLYGVFYPSNGHLPYVVEVTYQAVLPNGTEYNITIYDGYCTIVKMRRWETTRSYPKTKRENFEEILYNCACGNLHCRAVYNNLGHSMVCGSTEETLGGQSQVELHIFLQPLWILVRSDHSCVYHTPVDVVF